MPAKKKTRQETTLLSALADRFHPRFHSLNIFREFGGSWYWRARRWGIIVTRRPRRVLRHRSFNRFAVAFVMSESGASLCV
jgi:hypothetical protein